MLSNVQPPLVQLQTTPMHLITGSQGEESSTSLSTSPSLEAVGAMGL